jgi:hypothetical protein
VGSWLSPSSHQPLQGSVDQFWLVRLSSETHAEKKASGDAGGCAPTCRQPAQPEPHCNE